MTIGIEPSNCVCEFARRVQAAVPSDTPKNKVWGGLGCNTYQLIKAEWKGKTIPGKGLVPITTREIWIWVYSWWGSLGNSHGGLYLPLMSM